MSKSLREFEANYTFTMFGETFIYNVCNVIDYLGLNDEDYFESGTKIKEFANQFNLSIYSAPRDIFNMYDAQDLCRKEMTSGVIVEDLS